MKHHAFVVSKPDALQVLTYGSEWYPRMMYINRDRRGENMFTHHVETYGKADTKSLATGSPHWIGKINSIELLGFKEGVSWERTDKGLHFTLPSQKPCEFAYVLKLK